MFYLLMAILAGVGFVLALVVHVLAWFHIVLPIGGAVWVLHVAIFALWFPLVFLSRDPSGERAKRRDLGEGLPAWCSAVMIAVFAYAIGNFVFFMVQSGQYPKGVEAEARPEWFELRGFSGHWLVFYGWSVVGFASLYVRRRRGEKAA